MPKNIGFISTRFAGTDGVSLESAKWAEVLWHDKHISYWYSGLNDRDPSISHCVPEAYFGHPENQWINERLWGVTERNRHISDRIYEYAQYLKSTLYDFRDKFNLEILIPQNILAIPMHVPLGIAMTEFLAETKIPAIAHHHDFYWERTRFSVNAIKDYLDMAFPCVLPNMRHVVINQAAQEQLSLRKGVSSLLVPNVFDFDTPPPGIDDYTKDLREVIGLTPDDIMILQPTRIVRRKGIEHAIKIVGALNNPRCKLVISHEAGDEGHDYKDQLIDLAKDENVELIFIDHLIGEVRQTDIDGNKKYTLWDLYPHADLVTYPSTYEGFGNALLEAIYFKIPVVINRYSIFVQDIEPKGFDLCVMDGFVTDSVIDRVRSALFDQEARRKMVEHNYKVAKKHYSYDLVRRILRTHITTLTGVGS
ncbi:MAG: glycosyltransferase family 4 protein [Opitutales bacterium]|nr:glycosyltransferase family 4 protein [Opitutales bacterium]